MSSTAAAEPAFQAIDRCWVCGGASLVRYHECRLDYHEYATQDPQLAAYTGEHVWLVACAGCGFGQPEKLPTLPGFFDRMYDQHWSEEWIEGEFDAGYKDFIFTSILSELGKRVPPGDRRLLDVGAHVGRFMYLAQRAGWSVEGIELNPRTAACAARHTGAPVHQVNAQTLATGERRFHAVTLTDVLEHIPDPVALVSTIGRLMEPHGWLAVKVPCGRSQWFKERVLAALRPSHRVSLADNLVHVNHFSPASLKTALERAGFQHVSVATAAPELPPGGSTIRRIASSAIRLGIYGAARLPGGLYTPAALNLQAYAQWSGGGPPE
jgi:SAM-dependent methyltransferase